MHYYKRNIGDYAKKAGRLSMLQHGAYTLLIDACYDREVFPTLEEAIEWTWASTTAEIEATEFVLRKFFSLESGVYIQKRMQEEIDEYHGKSEINRRIAVERESKRKQKNTERTRSVHDMSPHLHEAPPNHEPVTSNQEPVNTEIDCVDGFDNIPLPTNDAERALGQHAVLVKPTKQKAPAFILPDWINEQHWDTWHSCAKRKKATPEQKQMSIDKLSLWRDSGSDYAGALENAAIGGYQGLFLPSNAGGQLPRQNKQEALEARNRQVADEWVHEMQQRSA